MIPQGQADGLLREVKFLRSQLEAAQKALDGQAGSGSANVADLERRVAALQADLRVSCHHELPCYTPPPPIDMLP